MRRCAADSCASCTAYALMRADHCARDRNLAYANVQRVRPPSLPLQCLA